MTALRLADLAQPGRTVADDERYLALRDEVAKADSPSLHADWAQVEARAREVLTTLAPDLLAAAYWTHARHVRGTLTDLADGLELMAAMVQGAWATLSPPASRPKARAAAYARWPPRCARPTAPIRPPTAPFAWACGCT